MGIKAKHIILDNFRSFRNVEFSLGKKITVISGQNGVGKSNILSLISSGSGLGKRTAMGSNFQPEFNEFFNIDPKENYTDYKIYIQYESEGKHDITRRLSFQDYQKTGRGIRIIPRTSNYGTTMTQREVEIQVKAEYGIGGAGRVRIPTIYLSLSRLYPLGEKNRTTVTVKKITKRNALCQEDVRNKFRTWYNAVIPNAINENADIEMVEKTASPRASLHMDIENTPTLSQSIGQDNIGNIISALVDIYQLSKEKDYEGALLCIDEVDVSLHPDTQVKLLELIDSLADELDIQFVLSTHSLTCLKEMLRKEAKDESNYKVIYIKSPSSPSVMVNNTYDLLKADMFGKLSFSKPKVKTYFEDEVGQNLFNLLLDGFRGIYYKIKDASGGNLSIPVLRNAVDVPGFARINEEIMNLGEVVSVKDNIDEVAAYIGCDTLVDLDKADSYFKKVIIVLDGDARIKNSKDIIKPQIRDYLNQEYQLEKGINERQHEENVCFLPDFFAPESFLYRMIYTLCTNAVEYNDFWKGVDKREDTALFTPEKIKHLFDGLDCEYNNDSLKGIFKSPKDETPAWNFVNKTDMVMYYYFDYKTVRVLIRFAKTVLSAYKMAYGNMIANRY